MQSLDVRAFFAVYRDGHGAIAPLMTVLTIVGGGWSLAAIVPLVWMRRTRRFATALAIAILAQAALVFAAKAVVGRTRPWIALGLPAPLGAPSDGSFPSGHAAGSFCVAAFLASALPAAWRESPGRARAVVASAFVFAALVALSRVYLGAHFPSDVLCGALVGALVGAAGGRIHARR